jgi:hypothetical protein
VFFSGFFMILPPFWTSKSDEKVLIVFGVFPYFMRKGILGAPRRSGASPGRHFGVPKAQFWGPHGVIWGKFCQTSGESFEKTLSIGLKIFVLKSPTKLTTKILY